MKCAWDIIYQILLKKTLLLITFLTFFLKNNGNNSYSEPYTYHTKTFIILLKKI